MISRHLGIVANLFSVQFSRLPARSVGALLLEEMRGACSSCWPSDLLGPPSSPVVPNASFMPTPEQCEAASSSWGRAAPNWLTDKIARQDGRQEGGTNFGQLAL